MKKGTIVQLRIPEWDSFLGLNEFMGYVEGYPTEELVTVSIPNLTLAFFEDLYRKAMPWDAGEALTYARRRWANRRRSDNAVSINFWHYQVQPVAAQQAPVLASPVVG